MLQNAKSYNPVIYTSGQYEEKSSAFISTRQKKTHYGQQDEYGDLLAKQMNELRSENELLNAELQKYVRRISKIDSLQVPINQYARFLKEEEEDHGGENGASKPGSLRNLMQGANDKKSKLYKYQMCDKEV